jgi:hypothetical protein
MSNYISSSVSDEIILKMILSSEKEIYELKTENDRLRDVIDRAAKAWLSIDGVSWEGDVGDAMEAAVKEIEYLRTVLNSYVNDILAILEGRYGTEASEHSHN